MTTPGPPPQPHTSSPAAPHLPHGPSAMAPEAGPVAPEAGPVAPEAGPVVPETGVAAAGALRIDAKNAPAAASSRGNAAASLSPIAAQAQGRPRGNTTFPVSRRARPADRRIRPS